MVVKIANFHNAIIQQVNRNNKQFDGAFFISPSIFSQRVHLESRGVSETKRSLSPFIFSVCIYKLSMKCESSRTVGSRAFFGSIFFPELLFLNLTVQPETSAFYIYNTETCFRTGRGFFEVICFSDIPLLFRRACGRYRDRVRRALIVLLPCALGK